MLPPVLAVSEFGGVFGVVVQRLGGKQGEFVFRQDAVGVSGGGEDGGVWDFAFGGT